MSMIHFGLILYVVWGRDPTLFFCMWTSIFPVPLVEKTILSLVELSWHLCQKSTDPKSKGQFIFIYLFLNPQFCPIDLYVYPFASLALSWLL